MSLKRSAIIFTSLAMLLSSTAMHADVKKGQKTYLKTCKKCHGNGTKGAAMHTQDEWEELFDAEGKMIIEKHAGTKAEAYFNGEAFKGSAVDLKDFLYEYGSDSGNVPSCG